MKKKKKYVDTQAEVGRSPGVNSINILLVAFLYESFAQSFFVLKVKVKIFIGARKLAQLPS